MKTTKLLFAMVLLAATCSSSYAQSLELEIIHKMNKEDFSFSQAGITNLNQQFTLDRLEYYISEITVTHDGGQVSTMDSVWILVDPSSTTTVDLSEISATTVESVSLSVGVSPDVNNLDPAEWPMSHPLAPKNPSMHWGWTAGYRFVAIEGAQGFTAFEIHALGNSNYFETTFTPNIIVDGSQTTLSVYADYAQSLNDIDISAGVITHGDYDEAIDLLENFRDRVFTPTEPIDSIPSSGGGGNDTTDTTTGIRPLVYDVQLEVAPNPTTNGSVTITSADIDFSTSVIALVDLTGKRREITTTPVSRNQTTLSNLGAGIYFLTVTDAERQSLVTRRIIVLQ
jgi:hypothetical protein